MPLVSIEPGDDVAILPTSASPPSHTIEIATVAFANLHIVRLIDHRMYSRYDGIGLTPRSLGYIRLATDAHRDKVERNDASHRERSGTRAVQN